MQRYMLRTLEAEHEAAAAEAAGEGAWEEWEMDKLTKRREARAASRNNTSPTSTANTNAHPPHSAICYVVYSKLDDPTQLKLTNTNTKISHDEEVLFYTAAESQSMPPHIIQPSTRVNNKPTKLHLINPGGGAAGGRGGRGSLLHGGRVQVNAAAAARRLQEAAAGQGGCLGFERCRCHARGAWVD